MAANGPLGPVSHHGIAGSPAITVQLPSYSARKVMVR
jgi:hypothetical protein